MVKSKLSLNQRIAALKSFKADLRLLYEHAVNRCLPQKELNDCLWQKVLTGERYDRLTNECKRELYGYNEALRDIHMSKLEMRYLIRGLWYLPREVGRNGGLEFNEATVENCHYVYVTKNDDGGQSFTQF
jgi:hypothetical protein